MIARAVWQRVHDSWHFAADPRPVVRDRTTEAGGVGDGGHVQDQVGRAAERRMRHHRVFDRGIGQDAAQGDTALLQRHERERRAARHVEPDRMTRRRQRRMAQRHSKGFADDLCRRCGAEELAAAAG